MRSQIVPSLVIVVVLGANAIGQERVQFEPEVGYPTFAVREPVLRIKPNTILVSRTMMGAYYTREGGAFPGEVGPFYIEGATTDDTLVVEVLKVRPNHDLAASQVSSSFGGLAGESRVRFLADPIGERRYVWTIDREKMTGKTELPGSKMREIEIDLQPMLGRVGVAPRGEEAFGGLWPGDFGGNMDAPEVREGTTVYLPIFHDGAYLYFGDGHARQGEGEVGGTGLETSMDVELRIDLIKGEAIDWPRLEDEEFIMVAGSARPLIDAFRLAHVELIEWLQADYGFDRLDAYALLGQLAQTTVANIVDPAYTVVAKFPKRYLPQ
ncbi:MAG TPA: acetamidase/formamidase family protein [Vicinamibacteria bacterium]|nr:acetamidase/formamidase family protein [Vicinamibacteria bacterium]